ncbi:hypothetical protein ACWGS9_34870, partial [Bradyrhizobium sp. Arg314]
METVDQPIPSPQSVNAEEIWQAADQAGQLPGDSWNTANFWHGMASPAHSPAQSVNQPSPQQWDQNLGASNSGQPYSAPPPPLDLGAYVPGFVHGDQRAEENLMRGM